MAKFSSMCVLLQTRRLACAEPKLSARAASANSPRSAFLIARSSPARQRLAALDSGGKVCGPEPPHQIVGAKLVSAIAAGMERGGVAVTPVAFQRVDATPV